MLESYPLLSLLIWVPIFGAFALFMFGGDKKPELIKWLTLFVSLLCFALSLVLWQGFDGSIHDFQYVEFLPWFQSMDVNYALGIDGFALPLIVLSCLFTPIIVISAWEVIESQVAHYMAAFLLMQGCMCGVFASMNAMLFYIFFEAMLIPMFLIIGIWGGPRRVYATIKFFLYTFFGSVFMLVALIYLHNMAIAQQLDLTFAINTFQGLKLGLVEQKWLFVAFFIAFAVKIPMVPVHTWLPDAHVEAPTGGSVILAAIMLKLGGYGFIRFLLPIVPDAARELSWIVIALSLVAVVYIGLVALAQKDMKKLIAYSSIAHMGFVTLGIFMVFGLLAKDASPAAQMGLEGAYIQMISHGFISGALFLCVGVLYDRMHSREMADYGGVINKMPWFASFFVLFALANAGLPGTSGFVGEFLVIISAFKLNVWYSALAALTLIFGAAYSLWMIKRVVYGPVANDNVAKLQDIGTREFFILAVLAFCVILFGLWPAPILDATHGSISHLLEQIAQTKI